MDRAGLKPTVRTFGCLAMGCPSKRDASKLLADMKVSNLMSYHLLEKLYSFYLSSLYLSPFNDIFFLKVFYVM